MTKSLLKILTVSKQMFPLSYYTRAWFLPFASSDLTYRKVYYYLRNMRLAFELSMTNLMPISIMIAEHYRLTIKKASVTTQISTLVPSVRTVVGHFTQYHFRFYSFSFSIFARKYSATRWRIGGGREGVGNEIVCSSFSTLMFTVSKHGSTSKFSP